MSAISPVTAADTGPSLQTRLAQIDAAQRVAAAAALQDPKPVEAVAAVRDLAAARFTLLASWPEQDMAAVAVAAYNRATRVLNVVADSGPILPTQRG